uniref:Uncharacterized protein n=1 Tax=Leersia perrieri TaxID=77586 RepID=A0A0D9WE56_9ORYZ
MAPAQTSSASETPIETKAVITASTMLSTPTRQTIHDPAQDTPTSKLTAIETPKKTYVVSHLHNKTKASSASEAIQSPHIGCTNAEKKVLAYTNLTQPIVVKGKEAAIDDPYAKKILPSDTTQQELELSTKDDDAPVQTLSPAVKVEGKKRSGSSAPPAKRLFKDPGHHRPNDRCC